MPKNSKVVELDAAINTLIDLINEYGADHQNRVFLAATVTARINLVILRSNAPIHQMVDAAYTEVLGDLAEQSSEVLDT